MLQLSLGESATKAPEVLVKLSGMHGSLPSQVTTSDTDVTIFAYVQWVKVNRRKGSSLNLPHSKTEGVSAVAIIFR